MLTDINKIKSDIKELIPTIDLDSFMELENPNQIDGELLLFGVNGYQGIVIEQFKNLKFIKSDFRKDSLLLINKYPSLKNLVTETDYEIDPGFDIGKKIIDGMIKIYEQFDFFGRIVHNDDYFIAKNINGLPFDKHNPKHIEALTPIMGVYKFIQENNLGINMIMEYHTLRVNTIDEKLVVQFGEIPRFVFDPFITPNILAEVSNNGQTIILHLLSKENIFELAPAEYINLLKRYEFTSADKPANLTFVYHYQNNDIRVRKSLNDLFC